MADITRSSDIDFDVFSAQNAPFITRLVAGEALETGEPCYIKSDGKVYVSGSGVTASNLTVVHGFSPKDFASGDVVSLYGKGTRFICFSTGMTPGAHLYNTATAGSAGVLATSGISFTSGSTVVPDQPVAVAVSATDIVVLR